MALAVRSTRLQADFSAIGLEPSGAAAGDLIIMIIHNPLSSTAFTPPASWTEVADFAGGGGRMGAFWIIRGGSAPSYTIAGGNGSSTSLFTFAITGHDATTPMDATPTTAAATETNPASPSITIATDQAMVITVIGDDWSVQTITHPSTFTEVVGQEGVEAAYKLGFAVGATGTFAWTSANQNWAKMTLAIRPAAGAAPASRRRALLSVGR